MRIAVLGATGRTGQHFVRQALAAGHTVRALVRAPERVREVNPHLTLVPGDARDAASVRALVRGADAVVSCLGPRRGEPQVCSAATQNVRTALEEGGGTRRYVLVSGSHASLPGDRRDLAGRLSARIGRLLAGDVVADKQRELELLQASPLAWTAARPSQLTEGQGTGHWRESLLTPPGARIARADLARFLLHVLEERSHERQAPFVARR
jgi:putative NADH-flavin reductase